MPPPSSGIAAMPVPTDLRSAVAPMVWQDLLCKAARWSRQNYSDARLLACIAIPVGRDDLPARQPASARAVETNDYGTPFRQGSDALSREVNWCRLTIKYPVSLPPKCWSRPYTLNA